MIEIILAIIAAAAIAGCFILYRRLDSKNTTADALREQSTRLQAESAALSTRISMLTEQLDIEKNRYATLGEDLAATRRELSAERENAAKLATSLRLIDEQREERERSMEQRFKNLANDILAQNSRDFKEQNEQRLSEILTPLRQNLDEFKKTVTDTYNSEARERFSLSERLRELVELNQAIGREAKELTGALKGNNQIQGDWGEMVLESILERSGLQKDVEYKVQVTTDSAGAALRNDEGRQLRPDVVVYYPDERCVIIDSKVSMTAFMEYTSTDDDRLRKAAGERHVKSVRAHIDELRGKRYQEFVGTSRLDFVMMFIPNEPAYIAAMRLDPALWQDAYEKRVLIVSPTHLVSALRLIEQLWVRDRQSRNAVEIAEEAGKMYDKFAAFVTDMERIEKAIESTRKAYGDAMTKLSQGRGNLLTRAQNLRKMGVKASKLISRTSTPDDTDPQDSEDSEE